MNFRGSIAWPWHFDGPLFDDRSCTINKSGNMTKGKTTNKIKDQKDGDYTNTCRQVRSRCWSPPGMDVTSFIFAKPETILERCCTAATKFMI